MNYKTKKINFDDVDYIMYDFCTWMIWFFDENVCRKIWSDKDLIYNNKHHFWKKWEESDKRVDYYWRSLSEHDRKELWNYYEEDNEKRVDDMNK